MGTNRATKNHDHPPCPVKIVLLEPVVPDDQVGITIVHPRLHHPLPPLDVAAAPHQRCHGPLSWRAIVQLATRPHRLPT